MKRTDVGRLGRKGGFTLVELIVVLVLMAVLASVAVPTYLSYVDDNKAKQCERQRQSLAAYLEDMSVTNSEATMKDLLAAYAGKDIAKCPTSGTAYTYVGTNTVHCDTHGDTTVILKKSSGVTAEATYEYETNPTPPQSESATPPENITPPETDPPVEPQFKIALTPETTSMEADGEQTFTVSITQQQDCTPTGTYIWKVSGNLEKIGDNNTENLKIKALGAGSATITCTSTAAVKGGDPVSAIASATVTVTKTETETGVQRLPEVKIIREPSQMYGVLEVYLAWYLESNNISLPVGGSWSANSPKITKSPEYSEDTNNGNTGWKFRIDDEHHELNSSRGNTYELYYKITENNVEKTYILPIRVIYPYYTFVKYLKGDNNNNVNDYVNIVKGEEVEFGITYGPHFTTDTITWSNSNDNAVSMTSPQNLKANGDDATYTWKFTAKELGESVVTATVTKEKDNTSDTKKWIVRVVEPSPIDWIGAESVQLAKGETKKIKINYGPDNADMSGVTFRYAPSDNTIVSIDSESGEVRGEKYGYTSVKVEAVKNGSVLKECWFNVNVVKLTNMWLDPNQVTLSLDESKTIEIKYQPEDATGVAFEVVGNNTNIFDASVNDSHITIKGKGQGEQQGVKVRAKDAETNEYLGLEADLGVKVEDPNGIRSIKIIPSEITVPAGGTAKAQIVIEPLEADLTDVTFKISDWFADRLQVESVQNGEITFRSTGAADSQWPEVIATKNGVDLAKCGIHVTITEQKLNDLSIVPSTIDLMQGETASITVAPDETGDIVIYPDPSNTGFTINQVTFTCNNGANIKNGIITAGTSNGDSYKAQITAGGITGELTIRITPSKMWSDNIEYNVTPWKTLKDYMKEKANGKNPSLSESNIYATETRYYVMKQGASLEWKDEYAGMTFTQFLNQGNNSNYFVIINQYNVQTWGNNFNISAGIVVKKNEGDGVAYYVYIGDSKSVDSNTAWEDENFVRIS